MLDKLSSALRGAVDKITGRGHIDEELLDEVARDIQRSLLASDVDVGLVKELTERIKERALDEEPPPGVTEKEHVIRIVYQEMVSLLGEDSEPLPVDQVSILLVGLFGSGKTTTAGKIARHYQKKGLDPCLVACDTYRPAAYEQLEQIGEELGVSVYGDSDAEDPVEVLREHLPEAEEHDVVIADSSGRDALEQEMIDEISDINGVLDPDERLLVMPADLGKQAGKQAEAFQDAMDITGVVVTKMDGTAKGGGALSACAATGAAVRLIGTGEKLDALEEYDPERFVSRLIGFGDIEGLMEKAKEADIDEESAEKIMEGEFTLEEFHEQMESVQGMGSLKEMAEMIPGLGKMVGGEIPEDMLEQGEEQLEKFGYIMDSMTPEEKRNPDEIKKSRIERIAAGSGTSEEDVRELLRMYKQSRKMMEMAEGKSERDMRQMLKQMGMNF